MQFVVTMRDGGSHHVEAAYIEVVHGPTSSSYTLLGPVPGYPTAILAVFPVELVVAVMPAVSAFPSRPVRRAPAPDPASAPALAHPGSIEDGMWETTPETTDDSYGIDLDATGQPGPLADQRAPSTVGAPARPGDEVD